MGHHDIRPDNLGSGQDYRPDEGAAVDTCNDEGGGHNIGGVFPGEWLAYTVDVAEAGEYQFDLRRWPKHGDEL